MADEPAKQPRWVWHSSAGLIHHPDVKCADCSSRQLHVSNAEALDEEFKAAVAFKRAEKREIDRLKQILVQRDDEIVFLRAKYTSLKEQIAKSSEHDAQRNPAPPPLAPPTPSSPLLRSGRLQSLPSPNDEHPHLRRPSHPPARPNDRVVSYPTSDPRLPPLQIPSTSMTSNSSNDYPMMDLTDDAPRSGRSMARSPSRSRSRSRSRGRNPFNASHPGVDRAGRPHTFRREIGSLTSADDFASTHPTDFRRLPPLYRRMRIFAVEDVEDLFDRQSHPQNSASKRACSLVGHLYDASMSKPSRMRAQVEEYLVEHYKANMRYTDWYRAG
ncbi:hypothetical protein EIP91_005467 [Steccherinum ochraceum]|uniref:Uncharacterized protein n=1 Tax=Steccherinum ochraceum TaxID=92696 RepID=A0A4R0RS76_9APHY|nr:hypothetical protein EIP91_005467 [Steccherinum ochraceum]